MSAETLQAYATVAGLALAIVGLPIVILQIRALQRSVRSGAHASIYEQAANFRGHLVDHPHLRKYIFDGVEIEPHHAEYDRVVTIAEVFLNQLEHIAVMGDSFGRRNRPYLERFVRHALANGPVLRRRLAENPAAYSAFLVEWGRRTPGVRDPA